MDRPGYYIYIRDNEDGDYCSISWQPVAKPFTEAAYRCRHGMSYTVYECRCRGLEASQTMFIPRGENVLLWDVRIKNTENRVRDISLFSYLEFSFHSINIDNQNSDKTLFIAFNNCYILSSKSPQTLENAKFIASEFALRLSLVLYPFPSCYEPS